MIEHFFTCPYCWQQISMLLDPSQENINYIEDCEVCCRPIEIHCTINDGEIVSFQEVAIDGNEF